MSLIYECRQKSYEPRKLIYKLAQTYTVRVSDYTHVLPLWASARLSGLTKNERI